MSITLVTDAIFEDFRDYLWAQLETPLSLVTCEQGNYFKLPPGDDLDDILPLVILEWTAAPGQALKGFDAMRLTFEVSIHYVEYLSDSDVAIRSVTSALTTIANLLSSPPWTALPGYTEPTKISIFERTAPSLEVLETFTDLDLPLGHGRVSFQLSIDYYE